MSRSATQATVFRKFRSQARNRLPPPLLAPPQNRARKKRKMSSSTIEPNSSAPITAAVITISDSCSRGERKDLSGPAVAASLHVCGFVVSQSIVVPDDQIQIQN